MAATVLAAIRVPQIHFFKPEHPYDSHGHVRSSLGPSHVTEDGFSVYSNMLLQTTLSGEPLGYNARGFRVSTKRMACQMSSVKSSALGQHSDPAAPVLLGGGPGDARSSIASSHIAEVLRAASASCRNQARNVDGVELLGLPLWLVGFSKAGTVLSQVLTEMAALEDARRDATSVTEVAGACNDDAVRLLDSVRQVHYLDAGLNCHGAHMTDARHADSIAARASRLQLHVAFHGTPRQWRDTRRPWIAQEQARSASLLRAAGLAVSERMYCEGVQPGLRQHFQAIFSAQLNTVSCGM